VSKRPLSSLAAWQLGAVTAAPGEDELTNVSKNAFTHKADIFSNHCFA
jgi:hypothetical protein